jgi:hemolysin activation/secretion protein
VLAATENGTTLAGALGMVTFGQENWRWRGFVGRPDVNLDFYGAGRDLGTGQVKVGYNLEGWATTQHLLRRIGDSDNWLGVRWNYIDFDARFDSSQPQPLVRGERTVRSSGFGVFLEHDSRDNFFTASRGWKGLLESMFYSPDFGGDGSYQMYRAQAFGYVPLTKALILGGRFDSRAARGEVPFYQLPFIEMRGIPFFRYQDENVALIETELRWNVTPRWAVVGFVGTGRTWGTSKSFSDADSASAWGIGLRRLVARRLGIYMGVDIARGPEETAIYIQAGSAWR